jgi:hypothetical protein
MVIIKAKPANIRLIKKFATDKRGNPRKNGSKKGDIIKVTIKVIKDAKIISEIYALYVTLIPLFLSWTCTS